ncbi:MAG: site-specific DNA-methyltransferase [Abitibacteriaceae bacterium]|nr:site-specific DNA-methyltransferase [Abditibacteriaceae bacterium]
MSANTETLVNSSQTIAQTRQEALKEHPIGKELSITNLGYECRSPQRNITNRHTSAVSTKPGKPRPQTQLKAEPQPQLWRGNANGSDWQVLQGDARNCLKTLPDNCVNCVVTSPPYYCLRDYGVDEQIGQEETVPEYIEAIASVMDDVYRVLKQDGVLFLNLGDTYYSGKGKSHGIDPKSNKRRFGLRAVDKSGGVGIGIQRKSLIGIPWRVATEMETRKWVLRSAIIWHRDRCLPEAVNDRPRRSYEYVFMFVKDRKYYFNRQPLIDQDFDEDVWTIAARPKSTNGLETAPYPDELVERCLAIGCPPQGSVLDCFAGGGTTLRVALNSGRSAIGIELSPIFCDYMVSQLQKPHEGTLCF